MEKNFNEDEKVQGYCNNCKRQVLLINIERFDDFITGKCSKCGKKLIKKDLKKEKTK